MVTDSTDSLAGNHSKSFAEVKAGFKMDGAVLSKLDGELKAVLTTIEKIDAALRKVASSSGQAASAMGGIGGGGGAAPQAANGMPQFTNTSQPAQGGGIMSGLLGRAGIGGTGGGPPSSGAAAGGGFGFGALGTIGQVYAAQQVGQIAAVPVRALDNRINTNREYSISADRLSVDMQQRTGLSQNEVANQYRKPLTNYRLGAGGVNSMLQFQNQTGIDAQNQANSVAGIRALTGYSMGTTDVLSMMQSNMDPQNANRQFMMMGGLSMYGPGGQERDYMSLIRARTQMFNLDDPNTLRGAKRQGSVSRYRMDMAGISQEEQDVLIQYGEAQSTFRKKGGKGSYDPNNPNHQKIVGIADNFATQAEESDRLRGKREEDMYRRQADNYADLEKSNQALIKALGGVEDKLSALVGARASTRPFQSILGNVAKFAGMGMMLAPGLGTATGAALMVGGSMLAGSGDPAAEGSPRPASSTPSGGNNRSAANDANIMVPLGGHGKKSLNEIKARYDFQKMHPKMQDRLLSAMRENPNLGWGGGFRSSDAQREMFLSRYEPTSEDTGVRWNGQNWKRVRGAPAAPPGRSMHEIGLAADMAGDVQWLVRNASRFGLQSFADVNNEPWHFQPAELPRSRREYEEQGASWGSNGEYEEDAVFTENPGDSGTSHAESEHSGDHSNGYGGPAGGPSDFTGLSIAEIISSVTSGGLALGSGGMRGGGSRSSSGGGGSALPANVTASQGATAAAQAAFNAGFRGDDLAAIVAIAGRESGWDANAVNPRSSDRGMWQINFHSLSTDNKELMDRLGVTKASDLFDINTNAAAAYAMFQAGGWRPWRGSDSSEHLGGQPGWDGDNGHHLWKTDKYMAEATAAAASVSSNTGDPVEYSTTISGRRPAPVPSPGSSNTTNQVTHAPHITIAPEIHFNGAPESADLRSIAHSVADLLKQEVDLLLMRSN